MLRFDTTTQISTKILFICIFQHCLGGRGVVRSNCDPKKPTLLGIHDYWTGVPTTFDLHCRLHILIAKTFASHGEASTGPRTANLEPRYIGKEHKLNEIVAVTFFVTLQSTCFLVSYM